MKRQASITFKYPLKIWLYVSLLGFLLAIDTGCVVIPVGDLFKPTPLEEHVLREGDEGKVAILEIRGSISGDASGGLLSRQSNTVKEVESRLEVIQSDPEISAVVLLISSPGGEVTACDLIYHMLEEFKERNIPLLASIREIGASGGYYIASVCDEIYANPTSIVGSIGVILQSVNFSGLMKKVGVEMNSVHSGAFKDLGSPYKPINEEHQKVLKTIVDSMYERFLDVVDKGRDQLNRDQVKALADGKVFPANLAKENGLIDKVGYLKDVVQRAGELAGVSQPSIVTYTQGRGVAGAIGLNSDVPPAKVGLNLSLDLNSTHDVKFYYLWRP